MRRHTVLNIPHPQRIRSQLEGALYNEKTLMKNYPSRQSKSLLNIPPRYPSWNRIVTFYYNC